ncbi:zinc-binding dehydrogenase [Pararhizobium sp. LjRoot255]
MRDGRVIARVSSDGKVAIAKQAGAEAVIVDTKGEFADEILRLTDGRGVAVVYDGSGPRPLRVRSKHFAGQVRSAGMARCSEGLDRWIS